MVREKSFLSFKQVNQGSDKNKTPSFLRVVDSLKFG